MIKGFKEFILRGNVIDLAVGIIIGAAFTGIVTALVSGVFNPLLGLLFNTSSLSALKLTIEPLGGGAPVKIMYGSVLAAAIQFLIIAFVVYFALVLPINHLSRVAFANQKKQNEATPVDLAPTETELLIQIRDLLAGEPSPEGDHKPAVAGGAHAAQ